MRALLPTLADRRSLASDLIRRDWLTPYQANQILTDKHEHLVLGSYRLRERIGEGAMGQVYKAWSLKLERIVAVKTIHKEMVNNPKAMERFRREVEAAAQLRHPNIALVRDADDIDGRPFLVMEYIEGFNLSQFVKQHGAVPTGEAVEYARQAALGLQHAFERGIVHRDIKPANLMVTTIKTDDESRPLVKILDFGLARYESERDNTTRLTQIGTMLGTIDYVSPEQATDSRNADIRADLYSLGCTLFYMLTARPAFLGSSVVEKLGPRVTGEPPRIRDIRPEIDAGLEAVLLRIMARKPEDRYQTPIEVAEALAPHASVAPPARAVTPASVVMMAMPVAPGAIASGNVPIAQPILAKPIAPPAPGADPSFAGMTATGRDLSSGATAAADVPGRAGPRQPIPRKVIVITAGVSILSTALCLGVCLYSYFKQPDGPKGSIIITETKFSKPSQLAEPGVNRLLVYIQRKDFKGVVKVYLDDLPPDVTSNTPLILKANNDKGELAFTVSYDATPVTKQIKVVAECEEQGIKTVLPLQLTVIDPQKKKKTKQ